MDFFWSKICVINVVGMSIEKLFDMWRNDEILKYYVICAAVSALSWLSQFCTSKNRFRENSKFRHFVTYQITFLLTCQPHKCAFDNSKINKQTKQSSRATFMHNFSFRIDFQISFFHWHSAETIFMKNSTYSRKKLTCSRARF